MLAFDFRRAPLAAIILFVSGIAVAAPPHGISPVGPIYPSQPPLNSSRKSPPPDANLYTTYSFWSSYKNVSWVVCGSTQLTDGCYDSGQLGPFGHVGALMEGDQYVIGNTVIRDIYVVDDAADGGSGVTLYVYRKTDAVTSEFDTASVTLRRTVDLPLTGGSDVATFMAANAGYLFIGTNKSTSAVEIDKSTLAAGSIGGFSPPEDVTAITSDRYGYVTVTFGDPINPSVDGFYVYGPNGWLMEDGGGGDFVLNNTQGISIASLPTGLGNSSVVISPSMRRPIRFKHSGRLLRSGK